MKRGILAALLGLALFFGAGMAVMADDGGDLVRGERPCPKMSGKCQLDDGGDRGLVMDDGGD